MARSHGRVMAAIWSDDDFTTMRSDAQRMFMFLLSQPDLSHAGLIPMRVNRWAKKAEDLTAKTVRSELDYLAAHHFIVLDEDTEEVLVRTFVRNDGVYKQPRVLDRMREDARQIESPLLRSAFRAELERLPLDELSDEPGGPNADRASTREQVERVVVALREDFAKGIGNPSEGVSDTPRVGAHAPHQPPTTYPRPPSTVPPTAGGGQTLTRELALVTDAPTAQTIVGEWIEHCSERPPGRVVGQIAKELKTLLDEGIDPDRIRNALGEWNRKGLHPSTLPSVVHEIANRAPHTKGQEATDDMFEAAMGRAIERDRSAR
ncbi:MAG: hypothetical protein LH624_11650 [Cryobacterium sp.]|nr:hypothetical protein [Cryobacterium sp.]